MVQEAAKKNTDWNEYIGKTIKLVYQDGVEKDGAPHYSTKKGLLEKVTKTHLILKEPSQKFQAINLMKVLRIEWD